MAEPEFELGPRGGLLQKEEGAAPAGAPASGTGEFTLGPRGGIAREAAQQPAPDYTGDIGKAVVSGLGRGAVGLTGLPGDIESLVDFAREKITGNKPGERYFPTSEEMIKKAEALHPSVKEALTFTPATTPGRYVKSGAEFIPGALIGPGGLGAKVVGGLGAGLAVQGAEDLARAQKLSPEAEAAMKIGVSIPAYMLGAKGASLAAKPFEGVLTPGTAAKERIASTLARDVATPGRYGAPPEAASALASGAEMAPAAIAGEQTKRLLQGSAAKLGPEAQEVYSSMAKRAAENAPRNTIEHIDNLFGAPVNAYDEMQALTRRMREVNTPNYERVMSMPEMQKIGGPEYTNVINRIPNSIMNKVLDDMQIAGLSPEAMGLVPTAKGFALNPEGMPLRFWDELKKGLDSQMAGLKDVSGKVTDPSRFSAINKLNTDLKTQLNKLEPYKAIRDEAAEMFGVRDWTELGQKYFTMSDRNMNKIRDLETRLDKATPERKMDFAYGLASSYKDLLESNPDKALALFAGKTGQFNAEKFIKGLSPLGENAGLDLIGRTNAEYLNRNIAQIRPSSMFERTVKSQYMPFLGGGAGVLADMLMTPGIWAGKPSTILASLAGAGIGKLYSIKEARIAHKVLEAASDPSMTAELGRLIASDPSARSFLSKTNSFLSRGVKYPAGVGTSMEGQQQSNQQQVGQPAQAGKPQAAGGRIGRASGGRLGAPMTAERLMQAAHAAKLKINKKTEQILDQPDEAVVKALSIAQQHI